MPTENENVIPIVRDINILLHMESYQDMTDEEIDLLIEYKINEAISNYENSAYMDYALESRAANIGAADAMNTAAQNLLQYTLSQRIPFTTVVDGQVVNLNE